MSGCRRRVVGWATRCSRAAGETRCRGCGRDEAPPPDGRLATRLLRVADGSRRCRRAAGEVRCHRLGEGEVPVRRRWRAMREARHRRKHHPDADSVRTATIFGSALRIHLLLRFFARNMAFAFRSQNFGWERLRKNYLCEICSENSGIVLARPTSIPTLLHQR